jgi:predicted RNase H-like HicB family nuclease
MRYPIAIETGDAKHAYGVVMPDLPGCFSAGDTLDEALTNAREANLLHLDGLLDDGESFPKPSTIEQLRSKRGFGAALWAFSAAARRCRTRLVLCREFEFETDEWHGPFRGFQKFS